MTVVLFLSDGEVLLVHGDGAEPRLAEVEHVALGERRVDLDRLLENLAERGCNEVLVEAGATLVGSFIAARLWDELIVYLAPKLLGSEAKPLAHLPLSTMNEVVHARMSDCTLVGDDLRIRILPTDQDI